MTIGPKDLYVRPGVVLLERDQTTPGYQLVVESNPANPLTVETLERQPEVAAAAGLVRAYFEFSTRHVGEGGGRAGRLRRAPLC